MKRSYSPRPATEEDIPQVAELEKKSIRPPWSEENFRDELKKPHANFWVVTDNETDEKVLAYAVFSFPAEQAHLVTFAVQPDLRRQGMASYLLRHLISFVMRKKGESIILEVRKNNQPALTLYQKMGFVVIRNLPKFYPDGEDGFVMLYKTEASRLGGDPEFTHDNDRSNFN
jgi:ribosomal-protein-alanine N-acetyltransferase